MVWLPLTHVLRRSLENRWSDLVPSQCSSVFFRVQFQYITFIIGEKPMAIFFLFFKDAIIYKTINPNFLNKYMRPFNSSVFLQSNDLELFHASSSNDAAINIIFINSFSGQPVNYMWKSILLSYTCFNNDIINEINYRAYILCWAPDYIRLFTRTKSTFLKVEDLLDLHILTDGFWMWFQEKWGGGAYICLFSFSYPLTSLLSVESITPWENVKISTGSLVLE